MWIGQSLQNRWKTFISYQKKNKSKKNDDKNKMWDIAFDKNKF